MGISTRLSGMRSFDRERFDGHRPSMRKATGTGGNWMGLHIGYRMTWGKYEGCPVSGCPSSYLRWLVELDEIGNDLRDLATRILWLRSDGMAVDEMERESNYDKKRKVPRDRGLFTQERGLFTQEQLDGTTEKQDTAPWQTDGTQTDCPFEPGSVHPPGYLKHMSFEGVNVVRGVLGEDWRKGEEESV